MVERKRRKYVLIICGLLIVVPFFWSVLDSHDKAKVVYGYNTHWRLLSGKDGVSALRTAHTQYKTPDGDWCSRGCCVGP